MQKLVYPSLRDGLVAAWCPSVDRSRSTLLTDLSGYGNYSTLTNMDPGTDWVVSDGKIALDFDGSDDCIDPVINGGFGAEASISLWLKLRNATPVVESRTGFIQTRTPALATGSHYPWTDSIAYASILRNARVVVTLSPLDRTNWHLVTITTDGDSWRMYQNRTLVSDVAAEASVVLDTEAFTVGRSTDSNTYWYLDGQIDDVRLYNRALSPSEIALLAQRRGIGYETYRVPIVRGAVAGGVTVTPTTVALTATKFAPTVLTPQTVTPPTEVLGATGFAPTVSTPVTVTPSTTVLGASGFAPTVTATGDVTVTPVTTVLGATGFIPTVSTISGLTVTPPTTALGITTFAPLPPTQALMLQELWTLTQRLKLDVDLLFALLR